MARIDVTGDHLIVHIEGLDRLLAMKSSITLPLSHVVGVHRDTAEAATVYHGLRMPGTSIPGVISAGSFLRDGKWSFWDVHDPSRAIILETVDEHYTKLVVGVDDPDAVVAAIEATLRTHSATDAG